MNSTTARVIGIESLPLLVHVYSVLTCFIVQISLHIKKSSFAHSGEVCEGWVNRVTLVTERIELTDYGACGERPATVSHR